MLKPRGLLDPRAQPAFTFAVDAGLFAHADARQRAAVETKLAAELTRMVAEASRPHQIAPTDRVCKLVNATDHLSSNGLLTVAQDWLGAQPIRLSVMTELPARAFPTYEDACLLGLANQHFVDGRDTLLRAQDVSKIVFNSNLPSRREFFLGASARRVGYRQEITIVSANVLEAANDLADVMTRAIVISALEGSSSILVSAFAFRRGNGILVQSRFPPHGPYTVQVGKDTAVVLRAEPIPNPSGLPGRGGSSSGFAANSLFLLQLERRIPEVQGVADLTRSIR
jgi:hypothetical protein